MCESVKKSNEPALLTQRLSQSEFRYEVLRRIDNIICYYVRRYERVGCKNRSCTFENFVIAEQCAKTVLLTINCRQVARSECQTTQSRSQRRNIYTVFTAEKCSGINES